MRFSKFFILYFYLSWKFYLSNLSCWKFWRTHLRRTPLLWHLNLLIFYLPILISSFFYTYLFRNFHVSISNGWKVWILKDSIFVPQILSSLIFPSYLLGYPEILMCLAYTVKKFEFWRPCLRGTLHCRTLKFCQILYFLHIYLFWKFHQSSVSA